MVYRTHVGTLDSYEKGLIELDDDLQKYAFSNIFEVAGAASPFERVAVVQNLDYVAEVMRVEGDSPWYAAPHDEFALVMDGEVSFNFIKLADGQRPSHEGGAVQLGAKPNGPAMGRVTARRGHQVLLPEGAAYQLVSSKPAVAIIQTVDGPVTIKRWSEICTLR
ncbi:hydroxyquinol 1,2-dioxygenase [Sphingobium nicotianae]|uniref:Hydroxyquinol 1,2-dioxygenase n=1 Tax=Sphingobium nicotianae TaxID=2782607 RepID=A0A9X1DE29_9SPHN|nr:hydroxyquinol 1,2-dioxygenase [Sphingobium nicotianae]MBT2188336.1 hydroxyquinol 1,2-dioxygenase [Sphingobium nicotianae]